MGSFIENAGLLSSVLAVAVWWWGCTCLEVAKCEADGLALGCHQSPDDVSLSRDPSLVIPPPPFVISNHPFSQLGGALLPGMQLFSCELITRFVRIDDAKIMR